MQVAVAAPPGQTDEPSPATAAPTFAPPPPEPPAAAAPAPRRGTSKAAIQVGASESESDARGLAAKAKRLAPGGGALSTSIAKVSATEAAGRVVDRAVQAMGRFGLIRGSKIERLYRNARPLRIYEGATEVLLDSLARRLAKRSS